jgi:hypothetical protein
MRITMGFSLKVEAQDQRRVKRPSQLMPNKKLPKMKKETRKPQIKLRICFPKMTFWATLI